MKPLSPSRRWLLPLTVLLVGGALSAWIFLALVRERDRRDQADFGRLAANVERGVEERMRIYEDALRGGVAFLRGSPEVGRQEWRVFADSLDLVGHYPGIRGIGVIRRVPAADLAAFVRRERAGGAPDFQVHAVPADPADPRPEHYVITYLEPEAANAAALGLDVASEPRRRHAAEESAESDRSRITDPIALVQDGTARSAFLFYLPVYRPGMPTATPAERRAAVVGWVYAPFVLEELLSHVLGDRADKARLHVFAGRSPEPGGLLYASDHSPVPAGFARVSQVELGGRRFTFAWNRAPGFLASPLSPLAWTAASLLVVSCLLAGLLWVVQGAGDRAARLVQERTGELVATQRELSAVNLLQRAVLDGTDYSIISTTPDGLIVSFNSGAERMLGYARDEMVGRQTPEVLHVRTEVVARATELSAHLGRRIEPGFEVFVAQARLGHTDEREWTYVRKDGGHLPVQLSVTALRDEQDRITGFLGIAQDLTARKRAEVALQANEERLGQVLGHAECLVWEARVRLEDWNWSMSVYPSGLYRRLAAGNLWQEGAGLWYKFEVPEQEEMDQRARRAMQQGLPAYQQEFRLRREGQEVWIRESVAIRPQGAGMFWLVGVAIDVTDRKRLESALSESEERTRLFAEHAPASVAMFDRGMCYLVHSAQWLKDYGLEGRTIIGRSHYEVFPEISEHWKAIHRRCLAGATEVNEADPFDRTDGTRQWLSWRVQPWRNAAGEIGGIVVFTEDITRQKDLEASLAAARDQALAASRLKSEFLANVSHEIRTPMNGVLGMAELLMDTPLADDQRQMGRVIQSSARNLLTIIDDILDFSKMEAGKFRLVTEDFSLAEHVEQALALMSPRVASGRVKLSADLPADLPGLLSGDAGRVRQVLVNLLGNAVKFTEQGAVVVAVRPRPAAGPGRYAFRLEVRDTGIGIPEAQRVRLFQPFVQGDGSTTRRYGGTGLGLAISRQLIELMGGRIGCESQPGHGSVFWFELDLAVAAPVPAARARTAPPPLPRAAPGARLLVAEDQPANQLVIHLLLNRLGLEHDIVPDGQAAIEKLGTGDHALVLMDCQMPRIDGYEATRLIRAGAAGPGRQAVPIVALTAHAMASDREKCLEAGMDDYLSKPIRLDALQAVLQRLGIGFSPAVAPPVTATHAVLDAAQLAQLRSLPGRSRPTLLEDLAGMALHEVPEALLQLRTEAGRHAAEETAQVAHRLAGAAANLGAAAFRATLQEIEQAAGRADWPAVARRLPDLDREWAVVQPALHTLLSPPAP